MKKLSSLAASDFSESAVWEFSSGSDDVLSPVSADMMPITDLANRVVGTKIVLRNRTVCWAILGNIDLGNQRSTEHFLTLSVERDGKWFDLARYHDVDYVRRGPAQLAHFLGLSLGEVFPIEYDISSIAAGSAGVVVGRVFAEPKEKLSQSQLIRLAAGY